jgi:hypothetical protein
MRQHHTKSKGDLGVLKAQADLAEQGYMVLLPLTEHHAFDLVIYRDGQFKRVQVKYRSAIGGKLAIFFRSVWSDQNGIHTVSVDKAEIDLYCVYCPETDECYYFDPKQFNKSICLRVDAAKNRQVIGVHYASAYRKAP